MSYMLLASKTMVCLGYHSMVAPWHKEHFESVIFNRSVCHRPGDRMNNNSMMEFYRNGDFLFYKTNNQIWGGLSYAGNHTFIGGVNDTEARFELLPQGKAKVQFRFIRRRKLELEGTKVFTYEKQG